MDKIHWTPISYQLSKTPCASRTEMAKGLHLTHAGPASQILSI